MGGIVQKNNSPDLRFAEVGISDIARNVAKEFDLIQRTIVFFRSPGHFHISFLKFIPRSLRTSSKHEQNKKIQFRFRLGHKHYPTCLKKEWKMTLIICYDTRNLQFILLSSKLHVNALHISLLSRGTLYIAFFNKTKVLLMSTANP